MPSIYDIKPRFQALLRPLVRSLAKASVTANQVTIAALVLSLAVGAVVAWYAQSARVLLLLPLWLFARMALNAVDGMLAREHGQASKLGAILNELGDVLADAGLYLPLALRPEFAPVPLTLFVLMGVIAEMTGVIGVQIGASRRYDGPLGKSDRAFVFGLIGLLLGCGLGAAPWLTWVLWAAVMLSSITIIHRARQALRELSQ